MLNFFIIKINQFWMILLCLEDWLDGATPLVRIHKEGTKALEDKEEKIFEKEQKTRTHAEDLQLC